MAKKPVSKSKEVVGADAFVTINIFTPGHQPTDFKVKITNICGSANLLHRSPDSIMEQVVSGLRAKYGERVG